jgi:hypothetical protein
LHFFLRVYNAGRGPAFIWDENKLLLTDKKMTDAVIGASSSSIIAPGDEAYFIFSIVRDHPLWDVVEGPPPGSLIVSYDYRDIAHFEHGAQLAFMGSGEQRILELMRDYGQEDPERRS